MKKPTKVELKKIDARITKQYGIACNGIQIPMMAIGQVFDVARRAVEDGVDDTTLQAKIREFVDTIRTN